MTETPPTQPEASPTQPAGVASPSEARASDPTASDYLAPNPPATGYRYANDDTPPEQRETTQPTDRTQGDGPDILDEQLERMWVKSGMGTQQVALYEKHPAHPNGEAFVGPGEAVEVAKTPAVMYKLNAGELVEGEKPAETSQTQDQPRSPTPTEGQPTATPA